MSSGAFGCPVEVTLSLWGTKWKVLILHELFTGTKRFGELNRGVSNFSQKMLTQQLRQMEADNLVTRKVYPEVPPRVEYSLTEIGKSLRPILDAMHKWGDKYSKAHPQKGSEKKPKKQECSVA
jgi:DNA-binding HxlR family transcriptional regulator